MRALISILGVAALGLAAGCMCDDADGDPSGVGAGAGGAGAAAGAGGGDGGDGGGGGAEGGAGGGGAVVQVLDDDGVPVPADYACLGTISIPPAGPDTTIALPVLAFGEFDENGDPVVVPGATVQIHAGGQTAGGDCDDGCELAVEVAPGIFEATVPSTGWYAYRVEAAGFVPTLENRVAVKPPGEPDWFNAMRRVVLDQLAAAIAIELDPSKALLSGVVRDCQGRAVSGASIRVFDASGSELASGVDGFAMSYFTAMGLSATRAATSLAGRWAAVNAPAGAPLRLEVWGVIEEGEPPTLLACEPGEAHADTLTTGALRPLRADAPPACGG